MTDRQQQFTDACNNANEPEALATMVALARILVLHDLHGMGLDLPEAVLEMSTELAGAHPPDITSAEWPL